VSLKDAVAVVAGASRGCGRGIALALGDAGAIVYATGRTRRGGRMPADGAAGTIDDTAEEVTRRGGTGVAMSVDHTDPRQVEAPLLGRHRHHRRAAGLHEDRALGMYLYTIGEEARAQFRYDLAETPEYAGRAVAALAADPERLAKTGQLLHVADLAAEYGFTDVDGTRVGNFYRVLGLVP